MFFAVKPVITLPAETAETSPSFRLGSHLLVAAVPLNGAPVSATVHPTLTKCPRRGSKLQGQLWKSWDWLMTCVKSPNMCYWISLKETTHFFMRGWNRFQFFKTSNRDLIFWSLSRTYWILRPTLLSMPLCGVSFAGPRASPWELSGRIQLEWRGIVRLLLMTQEWNPFRCQCQVFFKESTKKYDYDVIWMMILSIQSL